MRQAKAVNRRSDEEDVYIGRGSSWGNPFPIGHGRTREQVVADFEGWANAQPWFLDAVRRELPGQRLGCFCKPEACHGDLLAAIANDPPPQARPVFVFGANLAGRHGKGAAATARQAYDAETGVGEGRTGDAYALPTKDESLTARPLAAIQDSAHRLFEAASACRTGLSC